MRFTCAVLFPLIFSDGQEDNTAGYAEDMAQYAEDMAQYAEYGDEETLDGLHLRSTLSTLIRSGLDVLSNSYAPPAIYRDDVIVRSSSPVQDSTLMPYRSSMTMPFNSNSLAIPYSTTTGGGSMTLPYTGSGSVTLPYTGSGSVTLPIGGGGALPIGGGGGGVAMPYSDISPNFPVTIAPQPPAPIVAVPVHPVPPVISTVFPRPSPRPDGLYLLLCDQSETRNCPIRDINLNTCVKVFMPMDSCSRPPQILPASQQGRNPSAPVAIPLRGIFNDPIIRFTGENDENSPSLTTTMSSVVSALTKSFGGAFEEVLKGLP